MAKAQRAVMIGGGTMGCSVAIVFLAGGWNVDVVSPTPATRDRELGSQLTQCVRRRARN